MRRSKYTRYAYRVLGMHVAPYESYFEDMKPDLRKAGIALSLREYLSTAVLTIFLVLLIELPIATVIFGILLQDAGGFLVGFFLGLITAVALAGIIALLFMVYPQAEKDSRKRRIDRNLPFAALYMSTMAGTGTAPSTMFELVGQFKEFGEVSVEAEKIARDIDFGSDINTALQRAAERTPSENLRELLWGVNNSLGTGGDLRTFLQERARTLMQEYKRDLEKFTENLSIFIEIYIVLVIVGSVFIVVLTSIVSAIGVLNPSIIVAIQLGTVIFYLPFAALIFIILVKGASPIG